MGFWKNIKRKWKQHITNLELIEAIKNDSVQDADKALKNGAQINHIITVVVNDRILDMKYRKTYTPADYTKSDEMRRFLETRGGLRIWELERKKEELRKHKNLAYMAAIAAQEKTR